MKTRSLRIFLMLNLLLALAAVSVSAQSYRTKVTNIPFSFNVGENTLPAGEYTFERFQRNSDFVWLVRSRDGQRSALVGTNPLRTNNTDSEGKLVFRKYDGRYFLSQIWTGDNLGRQLRRPKFTDALAGNNVKGHTVVIALGAADVR